MTTRIGLAQRFEAALDARPDEEEIQARAEAARERIASGRATPDEVPGLITALERATDDPHDLAALRELRGLHALHQAHQHPRIVGPR